MKRALFAFAALTQWACKNDNPQPEIPDSNRVDAPSIDAPGDAPATCYVTDGTPANCFDQATCTPSQDSDFLNGCTGATCIPFDNVARLPLYNNGNLPALP